MSKNAQVTLKKKGLGKGFKILTVVLICFFAIIYVISHLNAENKVIQSAENDIGAGTVNPIPGAGDQSKLVYAQSTEKTQLKLIAKLRAKLNQERAQNQTLSTHLASVDAGNPNIPEGDNELPNQHPQPATNTLNHQSVTHHQTSTQDNQSSAQSRGYDFSNRSMHLPSDGNGSSPAPTPTQNTPSTSSGSQMIGVVEDVSLSAKEVAKVLKGQNLLPPEQSLDHVVKTVKKQINSIPYYSIPANSTLSNVTLVTNIWGEIPVNSDLEIPTFRFKAVLGAHNMIASNGVHIPKGVSHLTLVGYSVGVMPPLSCANAYVTGITFTWPDGRFEVIGNNKVGQINPTNTLGYLSEVGGPPCIHGSFHSDFPEVMTDMTLLGAGAATGQAVADAQTSQAQGVINGQSTTISHVTGSVGKFFAGSAANQGLNAALSFYKKRMGSVFAIINVPKTYTSGPKAGQFRVLAFNPTKTININKPIIGGRLSYGQENQASAAQSQLD